MSERPSICITEYDWAPEPPPIAIPIRASDFMTPPMNPGDYSVRARGKTGVPVRSGICARCRLTVDEGEDSVVRYSHNGEPGGIFHKHCAPKGDGWYAISEDTDG